MLDMILHLDELDEDHPQKHHVDVSAELAAPLLEGTEYHFVAPLAGELDVGLAGTTVRVRGLLETRIEYECGRCLETRQLPLRFDSEFVLMAKSEWKSAYEGEEEVELEADDMDVSFYEGEDLDLEPLVREAVLLELPALARCSESFKEACDEAYRRNVGDEALEELEEAAMDQRWAPLKDIKLKE